MCASVCCSFLQDGHSGSVFDCLRIVSGLNKMLAVSVCCINTGSDGVLFVLVLGQYY